MARPNVTVYIDDQSYVIPGTESGSLVRAGMPSYHGLIQAVGNTAENNNGVMVVESITDWFARLSSNEPVHGATGAFDGTGNASGGLTANRWVTGPAEPWKQEWYAAHNYLQYGGVLVVGATGSQNHTTDGHTTLKDGSIALDCVFGASGSASDVAGIATARRDIVAVVTADTGTAIFAGNNDEFTFCIYGSKRHLDVTRGIDNTDGTNTFITSSCAADVAGCIARNDKVAYPWYSPAGFKRGQILNVVNLVDSPTDGEMDTMYALKVNPVVTFPGEGTMLFGDKTGASPTSTFSRINVARLFIYLKKVIGAAARAKLFEINDSATRASFINAVNPILRNVQGGRGLYDYKIVCDDSNNTSSMIDSNQFAADIFLKPTKSINFMKITFTNKNTEDALG